MQNYKRPPISEDTKDLLDEQKPDGVSYDFLIRHAVQTMDPLGEGRQ